MEPLNQSNFKYERVTWKIFLSVNNYTRALKKKKTYNQLGVRGYILKGVCVCFFRIQKFGLRPQALLCVEV